MHSYLHSVLAILSMVHIQISFAGPEVYRNLLEPGWEGRKDQWHKMFCSVLVHAVPSNSFDVGIGKSHTAGLQDTWCCLIINAIYYHVLCNFPPFISFLEFFKPVNWTVWIFCGIICYFQTINILCCPWRQESSAICPYVWCPCREASMLEPLRGT